LKIKFESFLNTLPITLAVDNVQPLHAWLRDAREKHLAHRRHGLLQLPDVPGQSRFGARTALFNSVPVDANFPIDRIRSADTSAPLHGQADVPGERIFCRCKPCHSRSVHASVCRVRPAPRKHRIDLKRASNLPCIGLANPFSRTCFP